ncbi:MAG: tetratricopeptide repeat protein [Pseudomonadota bacterium]
MYGRIDAALDALAAQGLCIDIEQRVRLNGLLLRLIAQNLLPDDPDRLIRLITPIIAGSPAQQALCETTIRTALAGKREQRLVDRPVSPNHDNQDGVGWLRAAPLALRALMSLAIVTILAGSLLLAWVRLTTPSAPDSGASDIAPPAGNMTIDSEWIKNYPIEEFAPPRQTPWNRTLRWYYTEYDAAKWVVLLLPWMLCLGVMIFLYRRLSMQLRREAEKQNLRSLELRLRSVNARFGDRQLLGELQALRRLARTHLHVLDPERTALASAESAGFLRPRFNSIVVPTDFVVLIDRQSERDHLAAYYGEVAQCLKDVGLSVEVLEFNRDPTICHDMRKGAFLRLDTIAQRFPDSILLILASPEQLIDPARGTPLPATAALKRTRLTVLLSPEDNSANSELRKLLTDALRIAVVPATPRGLRDLVQLLVGDPGPIKPHAHQNTDPTSGLVSFFAERPARWMQTIAPRSAERRLLRDHLRNVLGPHTLRWLAATAIYPELRWSLTLSLRAAVTLPESSRMLDTEFLAVAQLPWFRSGWMPEWVRTLLQQMLPENDQGRIRRIILEALGLTAPRPTGDQPAINIEGRHDERLRVDNVMLDYLLPSLRSVRGLFTLPHTWLRAHLRKPLQRFAVAAIAAIPFVAGLSIIGLSLMPINECDLLAGALVDNRRVGPATQTTIIRRFFHDQAVRACKDAINREPRNGRFWYQLGRAYNETDEFEASLNASFESVRLGYPAGHNAVGFLFERRPVSQGGPDLLVAKSYYATAVNLGNTYSLFNLAEMAYRNGDFSGEFKLLNQYKDAGGNLLLDLALYYARGDNNKRGATEIAPEDQEKYIELLQLGRERRGDTNVNLGVQLEKSDKAGAIALYEDALRFDLDPVAAANLAVRYFYDHHTQQDEEKATYWAIFAAKLGNPRGLEVLANLMDEKRARFKDGYGPPTPFDTLPFWEKLAEGGTVKLQLKLAQELENRGDRNGAINWYQRAATQGDSAASKALKRLNSQ